MKILAFGEVMMRLHPEGFKKLSQTDQLTLSFTGTGLNILGGLAHNGYETEILTVVPDNNLGRTCAGHIRKIGVSDKAIQFSGSHMGIYLIELGFGERPSEVTYLDRKHSAFNAHLFSDERIEQALKEVDLVHICGIALSTSINARKNALRVAKCAHEKGIKVCFDFNFRASLNSKEDRKGLVKAYKEILQYTSLVFGSARDLSELLGLSEVTEERLVAQFMTLYAVTIFAGTYRQKEVTGKMLQGFLYKEGQKTVSNKVPYEILDRIGTGDAFVAGVIQGVIEEWSLKETVNYATHAAALAHTTVGDVPLLSKKFIKEHMEKQRDVIR